MTTWPILSVVTFLPAFGALLVYLLARGSDEAAARNARWIALWTTLVTFVVSLSIWVNFDPKVAGFQFLEEHAWVGDGISYKLGIDGISMLFVILTTFLMPITILSSWEAVETRVREYMIANSIEMPSTPMW